MVGWFACACRCLSGGANRLRGMGDCKSPGLHRSAGTPSTGLNYAGLQIQRNGVTVVCLSHLLFCSFIIQFSLMTVLVLSIVAIISPVEGLLGGPE